MMKKEYKIRTRIKVPTGTLATQGKRMDDEKRSSRAQQKVMDGQNIKDEMAD